MYAPAMATRHVAVGKEWTEVTAPLNMVDGTSYAVDVQGSPAEAHDSQSAMAPAEDAPGHNWFPGTRSREGDYRAFPKRAGWYWWMRAAGPDCRGRHLGDRLMPGLPDGFGGGGGGGLILRVPADEFTGGTLAEAIAARDHAVTGITDTAPFDANPNLAVILTATDPNPDVTYYFVRRGAAWANVTNTVRGPGGPGPTDAQITALVAGFARTTPGGHRAAGRPARSAGAGHRGHCGDRCAQGRCRRRLRHPRGARRCASDGRSRRGDGYRTDPRRRICAHRRRERARDD